MFVGEVYKNGRARTQVLDFGQVTDLIISERENGGHEHGAATSQDRALMLVVSVKFKRITNKTAALKQSSLGATSPHSPGFGSNGTVSTQSFKSTGSKNIPREGMKLKRNNRSTLEETVRSKQ